MVANVLGMLAEGASFDAIIRSYPALTREDISAAVDFAIDVVEPASWCALAEASLVVLMERRAGAATTRGGRIAATLIWRPDDAAAHPT